MTPATLSPDKLLPLSHPAQLTLPPLPAPRTRPKRRRDWLTTGALAWATLVAGCGDVVETEMFGEATAALAANLGEVCEGSPVTENEINVEQQVAGCAPGLCVTRGTDPGAAEGAGLCSCRCDGPADTGPFCSCGNGFSCEPLIEDLGLGRQDLVGSYCLPE